MKNNHYLKITKRIKKNKKKKNNKQYINKNNSLFQTFFKEVQNFNSCNKKNKETFQVK